MSHKTEENKSAESQPISFKVLNTDLLKWMIVVVFIAGQAWASRTYVPRDEFTAYKQTVAQEHVRSEGVLTQRLSELDGLIRTFQTAVVTIQSDKTSGQLSERLSNVEKELRSMSASLNQLIGSLGHSAEATHE